MQLNKITLNQVLTKVKKINVLFPEMSQYFLRLAGIANFFWKNFSYRKSLKIIKNILKIKEKKSQVSQNMFV